MEFSMQQLAVFNMDKRFTFPGNVVPAPPQQLPAAQLQTPTVNKTKKDKRTLNKKAKKMPKKKIKIEAKQSDDEDDDDDDEDDEDELEEADPTDTESSDSSAEAKPATKIKRKRSSKQSSKNLPTGPAAYPFPLLAPGAPYNPIMYPYGAQFSFPK